MTARAPALGCAAMALVLLAVSLPRLLPAQLAPNQRWSTLRTSHFRVHFGAGAEEPARRAAAIAEVAYRRLAAELRRPRGTIDLVVADNVDLANGAARTFPTNRIVIYLQPPLASQSLRFYEDWIELVVTHELTHIFHGDRASGWWRVAQRIFGRAPFLFPSDYAPAWVTEGLATYYESRLTGAGRVHGSYFPMLLRAAAVGNDFPGIGDWSRATSRYPGGDVPYSFGSLFLDHLAGAHGDSTIPDFVERAARAPIPFTLGISARRSFGTSFRRAWQGWRDSIRAGVNQAGAAAARTPVPGWRDLTLDGRLALYPRWADSTTLVYLASNGRETLGAYRVSLTAGPERIARRDAVGPNAPLVNAPAGQRPLVYAGLEFSDRYHLRSDLYLRREDDERRLTRGARLTDPDVRADGAIIAVRAVPATNQLVLLDPGGAYRRALSGTHPDTQWAEPRWSPGGDRIAVTRWTRGGYADVVVLDTLGALVQQLTDDRAFDGSPSWTPDGGSVLFSSDRTGITNVYVAEVAGHRRHSSLPSPTSAAMSASNARTPPARRLSQATIGLYYPAVSPDGRWLAAVRFDAGGWHIGIAPFDSAAGSESPVAVQNETERLPVPRDGSPARRYSPWGSLLPRYWIPLLGETAGGSTSIGALTSGTDVLGRHTYSAELLLDPNGSEHEGRIGYVYHGLGQPELALSAEQSWARAALFDDEARVGTLIERSRSLALSAAVTRPRARHSAWASVGGELERLSYGATPADLLARLDDFYSSDPELRSLLVSAGWSNVQRPALSISGEDGVALAVSGRLRWLSGEPGVNQRSVTGTAALYKSVNAPGFAHHVLAARLALGISDGASPRRFSVGGASGAPVPLVPGISLGQRRTFGLRGFPAGARSGSRAATGSLEYRFPLARVSEGKGLWPVFLDRLSGTVFTDAGSAWDDGRSSRRPEWLVSAGAELNVDLAFPYDVPYRLRLGVAAPVVDNSVLTTSRLSAYVLLGQSF